MKKQKLQTKLILKKETIVSLNNNDMRNVKGGKIGPPFSDSCISGGRCEPTCSKPCAD